jgi:hypothetical protein
LESATIPPPILGRRFRPFLRATLGPVAQHKTDHDPDWRTESRGYTDGTVSTWLGGGLDSHLSRNFALILRAGWDRRTEQGPRWDYGFALGFSFGRARPRP